jgi:hypothetical protein
MAKIVEVTMKENPTAYKPGKVVRVDEVKARGWVRRGFAAMGRVKLPKVEDDRGEYLPKKKRTSKRKEVVTDG